jgi:hypothetical protein
LFRRTQQLFDAVAPGDPEPWKFYLADDSLFFDEQGHNMDKKAFLEALQPLPADYSGKIIIANPVVRFAPGVAI